MSAKAVRGPILITLCCALAIWPVYDALGVDHTPVPYLFLAFFFLLNMAALRLRTAFPNDPKAAVRVGMAIIAGKLAFTLVMLLAVMLLSKGPMLLPHTFTFLAFYLVFLVHGTLADTRSHGQADT